MKEKKYNNLSPIHKEFFRFLKEKEVYGTLRKKQSLMRTKVSPLNFTNSCYISDTAFKRKLKEDWKKAVTVKLNPLMLNMLHTFSETNYQRKKLFDGVISESGKIDTEEFFLNTNLMTDGPLTALYNEVTNGSYALSRKFYEKEIYPWDLYYFDYDWGNFWKKNLYEILNSQEWYGKNNFNLKTNDN